MNCTMQALRKAAASGKLPGWLEPPTPAAVAGGKRLVGSARRKQRGRRGSHHAAGSLTPDFAQVTSRGLLWELSSLKVFPLVSFRR